MMISLSLSPEQQAWINAHVGCGDFASAEEAARQLIDGRIAERALEEQDDLRMGQATRGRGTGRGRARLISREGHRARNAARLAALKE